MALDALYALLQAQGTHKGLPVHQLSAQLHADPQHLEPVLDVLVALDWVGQLQEASKSGDLGPRYVLLAVPAQTPLAPLVERLLLPQSNSAAVWQSAGLHEMRLSQALPQP